jgi:tartrate dehydrogenase/decarboxylase / D-malate dehydrogenase
MFEPIHGSAPKYKGMDVANPIATIWAGSLLLDHLGEHEAAVAVVSAIEKSIRGRRCYKRSRRDCGNLTCRELYR